MLKFDIILLSCYYHKPESFPEVESGITLQEVFLNL